MAPKKRQVKHGLIGSGDEENKADLSDSKEFLLGGLLADATDVSGDMGVLPGSRSIGKGGDSSKSRLHRRKFVKETTDKDGITKRTETIETTEVTTKKEEISVAKQYVLYFLRLVLVCCVLTLLFYLKAGSESYANDIRGSTKLDTNPYKTLGLVKKATDGEIRKSYRKLVRQWHPDRNPGCEICEERIAQLKEAYEILGSKESRQAYDTNSVKLGGKGLESMYSVELTSTNYEEFMASLTDTTLHPQTILLQVYDPMDERSQSWAPLWDAVAERLEGHRVTSARINARTQGSLVGKLPTKVFIYPTILLLERDAQPAILNVGSVRMTDDVYKWVLESMAPSGVVDVLENEKQLNRWVANKNNSGYSQQGLEPFKTNIPNVIFVSNANISKSKMRRVAMKYKGVVNFAQMKATDVPTSWKSKISESKYNMVMLEKWSADVDWVMKTTKLNIDVLFDHMRLLLSRRALPLTRASVTTLCHSENDDTRILCNVALIDSEEALIKLESACLNMWSMTKDKLVGEVEEIGDKHINWSVQNVYVPDIEHKSVAQFKKEVLGNDLNRTAYFDLQTGRYSKGDKLDELLKYTEAPSMDEVEFLSFKKGSSACLTGRVAFLNKCLMSGEMTIYNATRQWMADLSIFNWCLLSIVFVVLLTLAYYLTATQLCIFLMASGFVLPMFFARSR